MSRACNRTYVGCAGSFPGRVLVRGADGSERTLAHYVRHSPDGFSWGYGGSGPSDLARCILLDALDYPSRTVGPDTEAVERLVNAHYQDFKFVFVANWPQVTGWEIHQTEVMAWLESRR
jgi:hypothetical protein